MAGYNREVAYRVFAKELHRTDIVLEKDVDDSYAPQYVLTPTGAKVNRVFVIGTLTEIEDVGTDSEYWRARLQDPTGVFAAYAGQYQIEAARVLSEADIPDTIAMVGKVSVYTPENGGTVLSIRPESVTVVDISTHDRWVYQTAKQTMDRIRAVEANNPEAIEDMKYYRQMVRDAFQEVI
ncbi:MAG: DNA-binding protein [Bacteroidetes bacterium]|nr:MAG: DNA-binding protein [Bacteroidota bacterium]